MMALTALSRDDKRNYIEQYNDCIVNGSVIVGEKITLVYQKLVNDLRDDASIWTYNHAKALHAIAFIEKYCKHSKGVEGGKPFLLELWQKAMLSALFGFVSKETGLRKYTELVLIVARKNGKSALGSAIALYMLYADGENGPEIYSAATKKDQAKIIWTESVRMVKKSPTLSKRGKCTVSEIKTEFNDGTFKPLCSESNSLDGLNVHCSLIDELHAIEDKNLYDVIIDGMAAREQPLSVITTTAGTVREGVYDLKYNECVDIIVKYADGEDSRTLPIIYELSNRNEWTSAEAWQKANPGLGTIKNKKQLAEKVEKAKKNHLLVKNLLCKDFNVPDTSIDSFLTLEQLVNTEMFDISSLRPRYGFGGVDLSNNTDLTAAAVLFKTSPTSKLYAEVMFWLPESLLEQRSREDKIPYDIWHREGLLRVSQGNTVHPKYITEWFWEMQTVHDIYFSNIGYDAWSAKYWIEEMESLFGKSVLEGVIQGKKTLSQPMYSLRADLEAKNIVYNNNKILKWNMSNVAVDIDKNANIQPNKSHARRRIDGFAALLNAYVMYFNHMEDYHAII